MKNVEQYLTRLFIFLQLNYILYKVQLLTKLIIEYLVTIYKFVFMFSIVFIYGLVKPRMSCYIFLVKYGYIIHWEYDCMHDGYVNDCMYVSIWISAYWIVGEIYV